MKTFAKSCALILIISCSGSTSKFEEVPEEGSAAEAPEEVVVSEKPAVCFWDNISVRQEPKSKGKWLTTISVGEKLTFLGLTAVDSSDQNREYLKVKLADGTEGWSAADFIAVEAEVAVFTEEVNFYNRPDLLTKSDKKFKKFTIVADLGSEGEWTEVKGKREDGKWFQKGWVKATNLSSDAIDIAVAKFADIALRKETDEEKIEALSEIVTNSDFQSSQFITEINTMVNEMQQPEEEPMEMEVSADSVSSEE